MPAERATGGFDIGQVEVDDIGVPSWSEFKKDAADHLIEEWNDRTLYGKFWYPIWLLGKIIIFLTVIIAFSAITGEPLATIVAVLWKRTVGQAWDQTAGRVCRFWYRRRPGIYK